jgi:hypothetical protein
MCFVTAPPARELGEYKEEGYDQHCDGPFSAAWRLRHILGFCFGCKGSVHGHESELEILREAQLLSNWCQERNERGRPTKSIKSLDDVASLLPKGILVQAMTCEAVHILRFSLSMTFFFALTPAYQFGAPKECRGEFSECLCLEG